MVLGKRPVPMRPTIQMIVGQGPIALAIGADVGCLVVFTLKTSLSFPSFFSLFLDRQKYCLKGPFNPKQPTNQLIRL